MSVNSREKEIAGGGWILEKCAQHLDIHERNAAQRVLSEVVRAWPGDAHRLWWKWYSEAAKSLGLRCKTLDCTIDEALSLAQDGSQIVTYRDDSDVEWFAVLEPSGRRYEVARAGRKNRSNLVTLRRLKRYLRQFAVDGKVRCVLVQAPTVKSANVLNKTELSPLGRLQRLLKPEWSDIWIVMVFAFVVGLLMLATPIAVEALVNTVAFGRFLQPIVILSLILLIFLGFLAAVRGLQTYVVEIIQRRLFARIAADLAHRLPRTEAEATDGHHVPELVNRFFDIVTVQKVSAQLLLDGLALVLGTFVGMAVLAFYHPWLLGFDVLLLSCIAFIIFVLGRGAVSSAIYESKNKYYMAAWLEDIARCPVAFRGDGGTEYALDRADRLIHDYLTARKRHFHVLMRQILFALGLQAIASTVLLGMGGWLVVSGELTLGQLVAAELIVTAIVGAFAKLGKHMESFYDLLAAVDKLGVLIDLPTERQDGILATTEQGPVRLELSSVAYSWPGREAAVESVSTIVSEGTSLAVVGPSGSGKTTLLDLMYGLRSPTAGHLTVDGCDPGDMRPDVLRARVALVRGTEMFHATIEENIHLHREDVSATDVRDVLRALGLEDAVLRLEDGWSTMLASGGAPLTENQCRLLGMARAIVGRPALLLVDGVLDGLSDEELEPVLEFLTRPEQPWTLVIATGREAIAERCATKIRLENHSSTVRS